MRPHSARLLALALALALIVGGNSTARAQEGLRGPGGAIGGFHLITMPAIQRELQLDERQIARAKEVASRMNARFQQDIGKLQGLNQDEKMKRVLSLAGPHYEEGMRQLRAFLKPAQLERYDQILFQQRGPMAMLEPKIAQTLQITNEQAEKVAQLVSQAENDQLAASKEAGQDTRAAAIKVEAIAAAANEKVFEILKPEQQRTWSRIVGKPFRPDFATASTPAGSEPTKPAGQP